MGRELIRAAFCSRAQIKAAMPHDESSAVTQYVPGQLVEIWINVVKQRIHRKKYKGKLICYCGPYYREQPDIVCTAQKRFGFTRKVDKHDGNGLVWVGPWSNCTEPFMESSKYIGLLLCTFARTILFFTQSANLAQRPAPSHTSLSLNTHLKTPSMRMKSRSELGRSLTRHRRNFGPLPTLDVVVFRSCTPTRSRKVTSIIFLSALPRQPLER